MIISTCLVQEGQILEGVKTKLHARLNEFTNAKFDSNADVKWTEVPDGSGYTAAQPSTSSIVSLVANRSLEQETRISMLHELCELWAKETGCSLDEIVGVINDPVAS